MKFWTKTLALALVASMGVAAFAQNDNRVVRRIPIRHADPYLIMRMLNGAQDVWQPEYSTIFNLNGNGGFGNSGPGGGGNRFGGGSGNGNGNGFGNSPGAGNNGPGFGMSGPNQGSGSNSGPGRRGG